ncbi:MAG: hypothetical protein L0211_01785 [Planctomycetaceae bacterium]|nr:hypothetical protein [Planctomycetaceae bacterium]
MNAIDKTKEMFDDDARFDRLVDGELAAEEYHAFLAGLDDEPGGWRRCALAFLEAQALGGDLAAIRRSGSHACVGKSIQLAEQSAPPVTLAPRLAVDPARWKLLLAMSASFLVAFILGVTLPSLWPPGGTTGKGGQLVAGSMETQPDVGVPEESIRTVGNAQLLLYGPGGTQSPAGQVPILEVSAGASSSWLTEQEPALPAELVRELTRRGHRVERVQQYVPVSLEDGREGVIPVESYQITPVSRRAY